MAGKLFQQVVTGCEKPLKPLSVHRASLHRAEAAVLMRVSLKPCRTTGLNVESLAALFIINAILSPAALEAAPRPSDSAPLNSVVQGNTAFAVDLYQHERTNSGNLFFSPYSISTALAMTYAGARGRTEQEMAHVLHFDLAQSKLHPAFGAHRKRMDDIGREKQISLSVANSIWCQQGNHFTEAFLKLNRESYGAEARPLDFVKRPEAARKEINSWIARKTQDKIQDILHPDDVKSGVRLVLCNAIYFKGKWADRFDPAATQIQPFFTTPSQQVNTPLMAQTLKLRTRRFDDFALFALPYKGGALSMVVLLPKSLDGITSIERRLDGVRLRQWLTALDKEPASEATVFLPKFKTTRRLELRDDLAAMGMPTAFGPAADFSGMTGSPDLFISHVIHQAFVDVNEEGTEAAAATAVIAELKGLPEEHAVLRVDHPFLFLIHENQTGAILFLGRVTNPSI